MNEKIIRCFDGFQIADLDDDMVGMGKAFVDWMAEIRQQVDPSKLPQPEPPFNFYKLDPHQPSMQLRKNYRKMCAHAVKYQQETDDEIKLINIYVTILAGMYIYHMPVEKFVELSSLGSIDRKTAKDVLLNDNMSPNWLKEPSGKDFTAIML
jgi:hypothetical protein